MLSVLQWKKLAIRFAAVAALAGLFCLPGDPGLAHSKGPKFAPADGSELATAPAAIDFTFARPVRLTAVRLYGDDDNEITLPGKRNIKAARERRGALPKLEAGSYRVRWRALSADGPPVNGEFGFTVDPEN